MSSTRSTQFEECFEGKYLFGDDFSTDQIAEWYKDEADAYSTLLEEMNAPHTYSYHALNVRHGFAKLAGRFFHQAVGLGSAYGHEFLPILSSLENITVIDPGDAFPHAELNGTPLSYRKPEISGAMPFGDQTIDLVTCFGALHHIPNVTFVVSEIGRVLKNGGYALIREPITNMGDWRKPRKGLTKRERGIPVHVMQDAFEKARLVIVHQAPCIFPITQRLASLARVREAFNSKTFAILDSIICSALAWNASYNRSSTFKKLGPTNMFWVCKRA